MGVGLDIAIGGIKTTMEKLFKDDNYLLLITSDNGGSLSQSSNSPLRVGKSSRNEGGMRNNVMIWGKHPELEAAKGTTYTAGFMHITDWHETVAHLGHATPHENWNPDALPTFESDGGNVWEQIVSNQPTARVEQGLINSYDGFTMRRGPYKVVDGKKKFSDPKPSVYHTMPDDPKCAKSPREDGVRLFNIDDDPSEMCDLGTTLKDIADSMMAAIKEYVSDHAKTQSDGMDSFFVQDGDCDAHNITHYPPPVPSDWTCDPRSCKPPWFRKCDMAKCRGCSECFTPSYGKRSGDCRDLDLQGCCDAKFKEFDQIHAELGKTVPGNRCNNKHRPGAGGRVFAQAPMWETYLAGSRRRSDAGKQPIMDCKEPAV